MLGDLRLVNNELLFVLWPSCDLVTRADGTRKVDDVLCARTILLSDTEEHRIWKKAVEQSSATGKKKAQKQLERLFRNQRTVEGVQAERFHFLPGVWDIPATLIDFASLRPIQLASLRSAPCMGTVASPFAEAVNARFLRYVARIGTPDLDLALLMSPFE